MVHCLACADMGNTYWGMGNYADLFMIWLVWFDVVMDVDCLHFVDNKVRHVEAVLSPCGGDVWEWKVRHVEAVLPPCGGGMVMLVMVHVWFSKCVCAWEWSMLSLLLCVPLWTCMGIGLCTLGVGDTEGEK